MGRAGHQHADRGEPGAAGLYGQRYFQRKFGVRHKVCWLPDCFGFSGALPQILRQGGIENFFTIKVNWSETNRSQRGAFAVAVPEGSALGEPLSLLEEPMARGPGAALRPFELRSWRLRRG